MLKLRREMNSRMLGNGHCARPVEMDCHFESICESCTFFVTTIEFRALVSFLWVPPGAPRSLRGRPSQVKGACGVAARWRKRHPGPASLYDPSGQHCGQARGLPSTSRGTPRGTNDLGKHT